jgi:hypothetical protein
VAEKEASFSPQWQCQLPNKTMKCKLSNFWNKMNFILNKNMDKLFFMPRPSWVEKKMNVWKPSKLSDVHYSYLFYIVYVGSFTTVPFSLKTEIRPWFYKIHHIQLATMSFFRSSDVISILLTCQR